MKRKAKRNDGSQYFKDWTTKKLKAEATAYHQAIYGFECFSTYDLICYDGILAELERRGVVPKEELVF